MAAIFADTAGWGHLVDASQSHHALATTIYRAARQQERAFVTTNYILAEIVALFTSPLGVPRATTIRFVEGIKTAPHVRVIHVDASLDAEAWHLLRRRSDKTWSLVDCASFVVMRREGITEAFTTDQHFEQAGFTRLLK